MAKKIRCPGLFCRSTDVTLMAEKTRTGLNLNPLHPLTFAKTKPTGKQKFHCNKCGRVFKAKI